MTSVILTVGILAILFFAVHLVFGAAIGAVLGVIAARFNLVGLFIGLAVMGLAGYLQAHSTPDPSVQWISLVDSLAQSHLLGVPVPAVVALVGVAILVVAYLVAESDSSRAPRN